MFTIQLIKKRQRQFLKISVNKKGQMLIELILAIAISAIILPALLTELVASRQGNPQQQQSLAATELFKQKINAVQNIRSTSWTSFSVNGKYHPIIVNNAWIFASGIKYTFRLWIRHLHPFFMT